MKRKNKTFGVIGLGRFGYYVARTLAQGGGGGDSLRCR